ncbi:hypothetical protein SAY87_004929 [Trapa incisa]|uniref:TF-B3 domain-containing protein n=1 Tax=Trapa incisa TaxID=236973 RepID=A0AAN7JQF9_9MYRT|nr:hypothetical protein SAY87_004929 [Trapa incisa]
MLISDYICGSLLPYPPYWLVLTFRIPPSYHKHMGGRNPRIFHLSGPSGNTWEVTLVKGEDELYFEHGWPNFVRDHSLEHGDLLVFSCIQESRFGVRIFGLNGCPKQNVRCPQSPKEEGEFKKRKEESGRRPGTGDRPESNHNMRFTVTIKDSNIRFRYMTIPKRFARTNNLLDKSMVVLRDPLGNKWPVTLRLRDRPSTLNMIHEWQDFSTANGLRVGDICVFQLLADEVKVDRFSMVVHINKIP